MHVLFDFSGEKETMSYFASHFDEQLKLYKKQVGLLCFARVCVLGYVHKIFVDN